MSLVPLVTNLAPNASIFASISGSSVQRVVGESLYTDPSTIYTDPSTITTSSVTINSLGGVYGNISLGSGTPYALNITSHIRQEQLPINIPNGASVSSLTVDTINGQPFPNVIVSSSIIVSSLNAINASISSVNNVSSLSVTDTASISTLNTLSLTISTNFNPGNLTNLNIASTLNVSSYSLNTTLFCNCTTSTLSSISNSVSTLGDIPLTNPGAILSYLTDIVGVAGDATQYTCVNYFSTVSDPYFNYPALAFIPDVETGIRSTILTFEYKGVNQAEGNTISGFGNLAVQRMHFLNATSPYPSTPYIGVGNGALRMEIGGSLPVAMSSLTVSTLNGVPQSAPFAGPAFEEAVRSAFANMVFSTINVSSINSGPP